MKSEINNDNKYRFIALYTPYGEFWRTYDNTNKEIKVSRKNVTLNLKHLSKIINEDAIEVAKIIVKEFGDENFSHIETACNCGVYFKNGYINIYPDFSFLVNLYSGQYVYQAPESILFAEHFLRLKGYALPWMGLSVEEMVEAGWIKLT